MRHAPRGFSDRSYIVKKISVGQITMGVTRRTFSAMLASVTASPELAFAQAKKTQRIDVHHHVAAPSWLQAIKLIGADDPVIANWSVQKSLDDMDKGGIATAVLSGNPPQVRPLGRDAAARIARESNEYVKQCCLCRTSRKASRRSPTPWTRLRPTASAS
jgi:5,10-methenyltetrahydromethanopterin hydrogenase